MQRHLYLLWGRMNLRDAGRLRGSVLRRPRLDPMPDEKGSQQAGQAQ